MVSKIEVRDRREAEERLARECLARTVGMESRIEGHASERCVTRMKNRGMSERRRIEVVEDTRRGLTKSPCRAGCRAGSSRSTSPMLVQEETGLGG